MPLLIWITAHFAPVLLRQLLTGWAWGVAQQLRIRIASSAGEWRSRRGDPDLLHYIHHRLRLFDSLMDWIERMTALAVWLRARELYGAPAKPRSNLDIVDSCRLPGVASLLIRLRNTERRLTQLEESAARLAAEWRAATGPLRLPRKNASAASPGFIGEGKPQPPLSSPMRSVEEVDRRVFAARRRGPALSTGPPLHPHAQTKTRASLAITREIAGACAWTESLPCLHRDEAHLALAPHL